MNDLELHIDQYLKGELSEEEVIAFEKLLQSDSQVKEEYELQQIALKGIKQYERNQLKTHFSSLDVKEISPYLKWAASISILITLGLGFYYLNQPDEDLFSTYFTPYPNYAEAITRGDEGPKGQRQTAFQAYELGNYDLAIQLLYQLSIRKDTEIQFYIGVAYLANGNALKAEDVLTAINKEALENYSEPTDWYLALSLIDQKKWSMARRLLTKISSDNLYKREEAQELMPQLPE